MPPKNNTAQSVRSLKEEGLINGISKEKYRDLKNRVVTRHPEQFPQEPTAQEIDAEYDSMSDDALAQSFDRMLDENPVLWQKTAVNGKNIPGWVFNTGNTALLSDFLNEHGEVMTYEQQHLIRNIIQSTGKMSELRDAAARKMEKGDELYRPAVLTAGENGSSELSDVHQLEFQNTGNGCWANFFQILASAKGIDLTQNDIKNYRPEKTQNEAEATDAMTSDAYNADQENNAFEMGDSILAFMPNTMLREVEIEPYGEFQTSAGVSRQQFLQSAVQEIGKVIKHAIDVDRSPVGILAGGHYITITSISGDRIKYKNSVHHKGNKTEPDRTYEDSLTNFVNTLLNDPNAYRGLQMTWMSDIRLSKDGKTLFGVPSEYVEMTQDGSITQQPELIRDGSKRQNDQPTNRIGTSVYRFAGKEDTAAEQNFRSLMQNNTVRYDKVYLPKKLDADYLRAMAEKRTLEEENRLRSIDSEQLGLDRKPLASLDDLKTGSVRSAARRSDQELAEAERQADELHKRQVAQSRIDGLNAGFERVMKGEHPELTSLDILLDRSRPLETIPDYQLTQADRALRAAFGTDSEGRDLMDMQTILGSFTYKKAPDSAPVNLVEDVRKRLVDSGAFDDKDKKLTNEFVYLCAKTELIRQMTAPGAELSYENDGHKIGNIFAKAAFSTLSYEERIAGISAASSPEGKLINSQLQLLSINAVDPKDLAGSVLERDNRYSADLAAIYDKIFGRTDADPDSMTVSVQDGNKPPKDTKLADLYRAGMGGNQPTANRKNELLKAMAVTALANGMTVRTRGKEIPSLHETVFGEKSLNSKQQAAAYELMSSRHNFSGTAVRNMNNVPVTYDVARITQTLARMTADIDRCSNWWKGTSGQFTAMKERLGELNRMVSVDWAEKVKNGQPVTFDMMNGFIEQTDALKQSIKGYLDHKLGQFAKDPSRRDDPDSYEQKRIRANISNLRVLSEMTKTIEREVLGGISGKAREFFREDLKLLENARMHLDKNDTEGINANAARTVDRQRSLDAPSFERDTANGTESLKQARDRILNNVSRRYDRIRTSVLIKNPWLKTVARNIARELSQGKPAGTNAEISSIYSSEARRVRASVPAKDQDQYAADSYSLRLLAPDKETLLKNSFKNAGPVPSTDEDAVKNIDALFGFDPQANAAGLSDEEKKIFKDAGHDFKAVYRDKNAAELPLSEKDFAALAFAGSRTQSSFDLNTVSGSKYNNGISDSAARLREADSYTYLIGPGKPGSDYLPSIQNGRMTAAQAMKAYEQGDIQPLAKLIAFGIKDAVICCDGTPSAKCVAAGEITKRLCNMLERDNKLKAAAMREGLTKTDLSAADSFIACGMIHRKAEYASRLWSSRPDLAENDKLRQQLAADIYTAHMLEDQYKDACRKQSGRARPKNPVFEKIGQPGAYEEIRANTLKMIEETELGAIKDHNSYIAAENLIRVPKKDTGISSTFRLITEYQKQPRDAAKGGRREIKYLKPNGSLTEKPAKKTSAKKVPSGSAAAKKSPTVKQK